jgi:multidrug efflux system membrane fusion protein
MLARLLRHPVTLIVVVVASLFALYEISVRYVAYTGDAYVISNVVVISAQIEGPISELAVQDNQNVTEGQKLFRIERRPYELMVQDKEAALEQAQSNLALATDEVTAAKANVTSTQAVQTNATAELNRVKSLVKDGFATTAELDLTTRDVATAGAAILAAEANLSVATRRVAVANANISAAQAELAKAQYDLSKTVVNAPSVGQIMPFVIRIGDYVEPGTQVLAMVTPQRKRVVANVPERHLGHIRVGQKVWLTLGSDPWVIHKGTVSGISPGIARSAGDPQVVPYVEPTTDWVRLPRRFPVEITLDKWPPELGLFVGADARVLIWF